MIGAEQVVAIVGDAGDARIESLQRTMELGRIHVLGREEPGPMHANERDIVEERPIARQAAHRALPNVAVSVDEPRHHDAVRRIDDLGVGDAQVAVHGGDDTVLDQHISAWQVPQ